MHQKRTRSSRPKLFQCKGYGDCNMVFTRSEHLARHARKHTGEKPFVCIVPECKKAFSRFDNMMQHTQTHRNNNHYSIVNSHPKDRHHKDGPGDNNRANTRAQTKQSPLGKSTDASTASSSSSTTAACEQQQQQQQQTSNLTKNYYKNELYIQTHQHQSHSSGLISPISLSSSSPKRQISSSSSDEEDEDIVIRTPPLKRTRRLSVADLCNPTNAPLNTPNTSIHNLTKDEFEALEGFGRFRHSPTVFFESLKDLAHVQRY